MGVEVFTTLDLKDGFFHVPVEEKSRKYTSFVTPTGQWEYCKVPFGLCNSPPVFQRYIQFIFKDLIRTGILMVYVDDVIILSGNMEEGMENLRKVLEVAGPYGLKFNWKKSQILRRRIDFLGYTVEGGKLKPSEEKTRALANYPEPRTLKRVHSFLGLASYFRKFISIWGSTESVVSEIKGSTGCSTCFENIRSKG